MCDEDSGLLGKLLSLRDLTDVEARRATLALLLNECPFCLDVWGEYLRFLRETSGVVSLEVLQLALQAVGVDPRSINLWVEAIELEKQTDGGHMMLSSACAIPLHGSVGLLALCNDDNFREQIGVSDSTLRREGKWPDSSTVLFPNQPTVALVQQAWDSLLKSMFRTLQLGILPHDLQLKRIDHAFCLLTTQLHFDDSNWLHHACFRATCLEDKEGAMHTLKKGLSSCRGSVPLLNFMRSLDGGNSDHTSSGEVEDVRNTLRIGDQLLLQQRLLSENLSATKKAFRSVGKTAESQKLDDWRIYNQWALIEEGSIEDAVMAGKVLERGLACVPQESLDYDKLAQTAERHFLSRHSEGEVLSIAEKRIDAAGRSRERGSVTCSWNRMLEHERKLGLLWTGKMETRAAAATLDRHGWYFQQAFRHRVGHLSSFLQRELEFIGFLRDTVESTDEASAAVVDFRSDKARRLEGPSAPTTFRAARVSTSSWVTFVPSVNSHPAMAVASPTNEDDVCGPRSLRGTLVHKIARDDCVESRLSREADHRLLVRQKNLHAESANTSGLPRQLGTLVSAVEAATSSLDSQETASLQRVNVRWLLTTLCEELDLGLALKKVESLGQRR